ncbi:DMT family transporter [Oscillospiraceae bacterium HV4-5-C5C]|nr:DMT family transporter [Oscillospiraceae bacterium HV4-5-C5C]
MADHEVAPEKTRQLKADLILFLVAAIWGGGFVAGKIALSGFQPVTLLFYRFAGSAVVLGLLFHKNIRRADAKTIRYGLSLGLLHFTGLLLQLVGLKYTSSAKQAFLASTYVVFTPFMAWLILKVRPLKRDLAAGLLALLGIAFISLNRTLSLQPGDPITLGFAAVFSLQLVLIGKYGSVVDTLAMTFYQFVSSTLLSCVAVFLTGSTLGSHNQSAWGGTFYLVFINTALAILLQNLAQRHSSQTHAALILSFESVFGFLFSVMFFKDPISWQTWSGCALIFFAILVSKGVIHRWPYPKGEN